LLFVSKTFALQDVIIDDTKVEVNVKDYALVFTSNRDISIKEVDANQFVKGNDFKDFFYFYFDKKKIYIKFNLINKFDDNKQLFIRFSNTMINEIITYKVSGKELIEINKTGIKYPIKNKVGGYRNFIVPIEIKSKENATFVIKLNKKEGRPLVTAIKLLDSNSLNSSSFKENIIIGVYVGLSSLFLLIGLSLFFFLKKPIYLFYALYILFLGLFITSYTGVFQQFFLSKGTVVNKYLHYVIFSELAMVFFVVFSQNFLETKRHQPKTYKVVIWLLALTVCLRILLHFFFNKLFTNFIPTFMKVWYFMYLLGIIIVAYQIITLYNKNTKKNILFAIAYLLMILGTLLSILYHSYGLVDGIIYNLPLLLFTSLLEIIFITISLGLIVKEVIEEKKGLLKKIEEQKQQNLIEFLTLNNKNKVYLDSLKFVKSDGNYLEFYLDDKKILDRNKLKDIEENLPTNFVRIHRSYIINKNYIQTTTSTSIILDTNITIPLSRFYKKNL